MRFNQLAVRLAFCLAVHAISSVTSFGQIAQGQISPVTNIAILDFDVIGRGIDPSMGEALAGIIRSAVVRGEGVRLIERSKLAAVLREQDLQLTDMVDPKTAVAVGRIAGVDRLILGTIAAVTDTTTVTCRVIDVTTGEAADAEEFALDSVERYAQLGRLLAALIGEQPIAEDSIALPPYLNEKFQNKETTLPLGAGPKGKGGASINQGQYILGRRAAGNQYAWIPNIKPGFYLQADVALTNAPAGSGAGIVWGAKGSGDYLSICFDGDQVARIDQRQGGGTTTSLTVARDWYALNEPPRSNRLRVESWLGRHRVFINGVCFDDFDEPGYDAGRVGLRALLRTDGGRVSCTLDNLVVGRLDPRLAGIQVRADNANPRSPKRARKAREPRSKGPWAAISKVWLTRDGQFDVAGFHIHAAVEVGNCRAGKLRAAAQFFDAVTGKPIRDVDGRYCNAEGEVVAERLFTPRHRKSTYTDLKMFIPERQLHIPRGVKKLKCRVVLIDKSSKRPVRLARSEEISFRLRK